MIRITERESGKPFTLEECAKEHGVHINTLTTPYIAIYADGVAMVATDVDNEEFTEPFDNQRFHIQIDNANEV